MYTDMCGSVRTKYISYNKEDSIYSWYEYSYDSDGNQIEYVRYNSDGSRGNWIEYIYE